MYVKDLTKSNTSFLEASFSSELTLTLGLSLPSISILAGHFPWVLYLCSLFKFWCSWIPISSHFVSSSWVLVPTHTAYTVLVCISWLPNLFLQPRRLPLASDQYIHGNLHLDVLIRLNTLKSLCSLFLSIFTLFLCSPTHLVAPLSFYLKLRHESD